MEGVYWQNVHISQGLLSSPIKCPFLVNTILVIIIRTMTSRQNSFKVRKSTGVMEGPTDQRTDGPTDGPTECLIESRARDKKLFLSLGRPLLRST